MKYDATYVVPAVIATGRGEVQLLPPAAVSLVNVPVASSVPVEDHKLPICAPVSSDSL